MCCPAGGGFWYYVESCQAIGFGSFLASTNVLKAIVIHAGAEASSDSSYLLDPTPETSSWSDSVLVAGKSFYAPDAGVTLALVSVSNAEATVSVSFAPLSCVQATMVACLLPEAVEAQIRGGGTMQCLPRLADMPGKFSVDKMVQSS